MNQVKRMIPNMLEEYNLIITQDKTEMYKISRKSDEEWKKCKYLGPMLGTEEDINRRKSLLLDAFKTMEDILLRSKKISEKIRICVFKTYLETYFCTTQNYGHLQAHLISKLIVSRENS